MGNPVNAGDLTGRQRAKALAENEEELLRRQNEITTANKVAAKSLETEVIDLSNPSLPVIVQEEEVEVAEKMVRIRVNESIKPTFARVTYDLTEVGRKYEVPAFLAEWLEERGVIWH